MVSVSNQPTKITRTERGLVIAGTRITLYQFMDYIHGRYGRSLIRQHFPQITDEQFEATMSYIEANRAEIEAEYQMVVKNDEEIRQYWEEQNRAPISPINSSGIIGTRLLIGLKSSGVRSLLLNPTSLNPC